MKQLDHTAESERPVRLLQIGLGGWGRDWYRRRLRDNPLVDVAGLVDQDEQTLGVAAEEFALPERRCFTSVEDALKELETDAVLVTASLPGHVPSARAAIAAGRHVLMEKPFAPSVSEARELVTEAARAGLVLMISQNYRFFPAPLEASRIVRDEELGRLGAVHIDFRKGNVVYDAGRQRHYDLPHPLLADMAIHHFDLMRMVTGADARRIRCHSYNLPWSHFREDPAAEAVVEMETGVVVTYRGSWVSQGPETPWSGEWRLEFEKGQLRFQSRADETGELDRVWLRKTGGKERRLKLAPIGAADRSGSIAAFVNAVRNGTQPATSGAANVGSIGLTYAAIEAAASDRWVPVEH